MKRKMGLPEIDFVLYLWKKWIFLEFCYKGIGQNTNLFPKKSNLEPIKSKKRAKSEFTEVNRSLLQLKGIAI